jgi:hypothetical protein
MRDLNSAALGESRSHGGTTALTGPVGRQPRRQGWACRSRCKKDLRDSRLQARHAFGCAQAKARSLARHNGPSSAGTVPEPRPPSPCPRPPADGAPRSFSRRPLPTERRGPCSALGSSGRVGAPSRALTRQAAGRLSRRTPPSTRYSGSPKQFDAVVLAQVGPPSAIAQSSLPGCVHHARKPRESWCIRGVLQTLIDRSPGGKSSCLDTTIRNPRK